MSSGMSKAHARQRAQLLPLAFGRPCPLCGAVMLEDQKLHLDHKVPRRLGGSSDWSNLQIVHAVCNLRKAGRQFGRLGAAARGRPRRVVVVAWVSRW
jgi:5-methylcytosine-specific restriction endonuclease McrA